MTAQGVIVAVSPATTVVTPTAHVFNYAYCRASDKGWLGTLRGITSQPTFVGKINAGTAALTLDIDHYPSELTLGNLIRVTYPSGQVAGYWKYEGRKSVMAVTNGYVITLTPLVAELKDVPFNANYSADTTQPTTALGPATFDVPIKAAIAQTLHLTAGTINNDGVAYSYVFNNSTGQDPVNQAMTFAGSSWWWDCDPMGRVTVTNTSPFAHVFRVGREITAGTWDDDTLSLINTQTVVGGTGPNGTTSFTAVASDVNPANPYSVPNIGQRAGGVWQDSSLNTQASVNAVSASLLGYGERVTSTRDVAVTGYTLRRPRQGDACYLVEPDPSVNDPAKNGPVVKLGPYLITDVQEFGATNCFQLKISASMVVPVLSYNPQAAMQQAVLKLMQQPRVQPVSNNGTVGSIGNGVVGGAAASGALNSTPSAPVGLAATTGIDNLAQLNNAYVSLSWSPNTFADGVVRYLVQWRKSTDPDVAASYYQASAQAAVIKIPGLFQGTPYTFQVAGLNSAGVQGPWATLGETTALDNAAPAVPVGLSGLRTPRGALVSWTGNTEPDLQGYVLQVSIDGVSQGWQTVTPGYSLDTSYQYTAPKGTPQGTILYFRVAAIDWTGNLSAYSPQTPAIFTDGITFDELDVGTLNVYGLLSATGGLSTRSKAPNGAASGAGTDIAAAAITSYDGTLTDHGGGPGVTFNVNNTTGNVFVSGTVSASQLQGVAGGSSGTGARMWIDLKDTTAGVGPLLDVNDGTYDRVQIGHITGGEFGASSVYGMRSLDSGGNVLWDSLGLVGVLSNIGSNGGQTGTVGSTGSWVNVPNCSAAFSVSTRPQNLIAYAKFSVDMSGVANPASNLRLIYSGGSTFTGFQVNYGWAMSGAGEGITIPVMLFYDQFLIPVGSWTIQLQIYNITAGQSTTISNFDVDVYQYGA